ncbi:MAG: hypothetical protein EOO40_03000 [Deltaproteobacteria bacterium]|nr:MAG: hypothetical protein EOO40_03000 [Deltaproteobacteria bacterium]
MKLLVRPSPQLLFSSQTINCPARRSTRRQLLVLSRQPKGRAGAQLRRRQRLEQALKAPVIKQTTQFAFDSLAPLGGASAALCSSAALTKIQPSLQGNGLAALLVPVALAGLGGLSLWRTRRPNDLTTTATLLALATGVQCSPYSGSLLQLPTVLGVMALAYIKVEAAVDRQQKLWVRGYRAHSEALRQTAEDGEG